MGTQRVKANRKSDIYTTAGRDAQRRARRARRRLYRRAAAVGAPKLVDLLSIAAMTADGEG